MARSLITRFYNSPYLQIDDDKEWFLFPSGTDREEIIDTLENYFEFRGWERSRRYEVIGDVLNSNSFHEVSGTALDTAIYTNVSFGAIEVDP
jgi:hypothetical protein